MHNYMLITISQTLILTLYCKYMLINITQYNVYLHCNFFLFFCKTLIHHSFLFTTCVIDIGQS